MSDFRYALRQLAKSPGFSLVAIFTLALGIGANTAIFAVFDAVLLKPLPFNKPDQLVQIYGSGPQLDRAPNSPANFLDWRKQNRVFQHISAIAGEDFTLLGRDLPERLRGARVSHDFFDLLGVPPSLGRSFRSDEDELGRNQVVVISHELWQKLFAGRNDVIGQEIRLSDKSYTVVGVMPAGASSSAMEDEAVAVRFGFGRGVRVHGAQRGGVRGGGKVTRAQYDETHEIAATRITERGETRADDRASEAAMEDRKRVGYF